MLATGTVYCGSAPAPEELWARWNLDPWLLLGLTGVALALFLRARRGATGTGPGALGLLVLVLAFVSPLCALSSALFSARVAHHLLLVAAAAPLLAWSPPSGRKPPLTAWAAAHAVLFWVWHAPAPYGWALSQPLVYWLMQITLLGSALGFWRAVFARWTDAPGTALALAAVTGQMGLLGAVLTFAPRPLYAPHIGPTWAWGLDPLQDQQLAGLLMWTLGALPYLFAGLWCLSRLFREPDGGLAQGAP